MIINGVEVIVGEKYYLDTHEVEILEAVAEDPGHLPYIRVRVTNDPDGETDIEWELWYGAGEYYTKDGWHGVDGEAPRDEPTVELIKK